MTGATLDVVGVGNAIVDVLASVDDAFIEEQGFDKGVMTLIDGDQAEAIYARMGPAVEMSGGSVANTIAGIASLGGRCGFIGRVRDDQLGEIFRHDVRALGVRYETPPATAGKPTARCFVFVTPDAQRTMMTFLGASTQLAPEDVDPALIRSAAVTYLEGYLWDDPNAKAAMVGAAEAAHGGGGRVALSLSDPFCVDRHRVEFLDLIASHVDIVFANEKEAESLFEIEGVDVAAGRLAELVEVAVVTRGPKGSIAMSNGERVEVAAEPIAKVVDTTGAGDLYAAGFLYGLTRGRDLGHCARLGGLAAAEAISHMGARPETSLAKLAAAKGL